MSGPMSDSVRTLVFVLFLLLLAVISGIFAHQADVRTGAAPDYHNPAEEKRPDSLAR